MAIALPPYDISEYLNERARGVAGSEYFNAYASAQKDALEGGNNTIDNPDAILKEILDNWEQVELSAMVYTQEQSDAMMDFRVKCVVGGKTYTITLMKEFDAKQKTKVVSYLSVDGKTRKIVHAQGPVDKIGPFMEKYMDLGTGNGERNPIPQGALRDEIKINIQYMFNAVARA